MNTKKTSLSRKPQRLLGFILVEVIVSISILMLVVPAALTVASKSVTLSSYSKDQVIATYLAEEGLEIIRNRRDQNMLRISQGGAIQWNDGFWPGTSNNCKRGLKCIVDLGWGLADPVIATCVGTCSFILSMDTVSGAYAHQSGGTWVPTRFSRYVQTSDVSGGSNPNEIRVTSAVTYNTHGVDRTITLTENLTPWI